MDACKAYKREEDCNKNKAVFNHLQTTTGQKCFRYNRNYTVYVYIGVKHFLYDVTTIRNGPIISTEKKEGREKRRLSCCKKVVVRKDWKTTLHMLYSQATEVVFLYHDISAAG